MRSMANGICRRPSTKVRLPRCSGTAGNYNSNRKDLPTPGMSLRIESTDLTRAAYLEEDGTPKHPKLRRY